MKSIRKTILQFRQGNSDKVYEVELCEVSDARFVVNFRYGRRGSTLREGTKTTVAVSLDQANEIFDTLVESKTKKGYSEAESFSPSMSSPVTVPAGARAEANDDPRITATLERLQKGLDRFNDWKLSRAIWRAGELRIDAAAPILCSLIGQDAMTDYSIVFALGRIGDPNSVATLERLADQHAAHQPHIANLAREALRLVVDEATQSRLIAETVAALPISLRDAFEQADGVRLESLVLDGLNQKQLVPETLTQLYFIDNEIARSALLSALKLLDLSPPYFRQIRRLFKTSELRRDGEVFGLLAHRFEKYQCKFRVPQYTYSWQNYVKPSLGENPEHAFSAQSREYFRRRVWSTLRRLGELGDADFVPMAVGTLLAFSDEDAREVQTNSRYDWQTRTYSYVHWDVYGGYWAFNQLLYRNSPRFVAAKKSFQVAAGWQPGSDPPKENEAAFPELWQQEPRGLVHLLMESRCRPVHEFASRALRQCSSFCEQLPLEVIKQFLACHYDVTVRLGFELAISRYNPNEPDLELVLALACCSVPEARLHAKKWIDANRSLFFHNVDFIVGILLADWKDTRVLGSEAAVLLPSDDSFVTTLTARLIAFLQAAETGQAEIAADVAQFLLRSQFAAAVSTLGEDILIDLFQNPLEEVQTFAGSVVIGHRTLAAQPTERILRAMLDATHAPVRAMAIRVLAELPHSSLTQNVEMLASLACHELADVRAEVRPLLRNLASDSRFARNLVTCLIRRLLTPGAPDGVPTATSKLILEDFDRHLDHVPAETVWQLLQSRSSPAQQVGGVLLGSNVDSQSLSVSEIVKLSSHDILSVRRAAWKMYADDLPRMKNALATAIRILDAKWEDSRQFGFQFVRERMEEDDLTPEVLISICDSVRSDVQQFGREMVTQRFQEKDGPEYLLKLSEHPTAEIQLFVTHFLVEYGANQPDRILQLKPYFISILSRVNKSRVAKDRVLEFLIAESSKDLTIAKMTAEILDRISATCAIGDKSRSIEGMIEIRESYPEVELPIQLRPISSKTNEVAK